MEKSPEEQKKEIVEGINNGDARAIERLRIEPDGSIDFYLDYGSRHFTDIIRTHPLTPPAASPEETIKNLEAIGMQPDKARELHSHLLDERERGERSRQSEAEARQRQEEASKPTQEETIKSAVEELKSAAQERLEGKEVFPLGFNLNPDGSVTYGLGDQKVQLAPPAKSEKDVIGNLEKVLGSREEAQEAYKILKEGAERSGIHLDFEQEKGSSAQPHEPPSQYAALLKESGLSREAGYPCQDCKEVRVAHVGGEGRSASEERTH